MKFILLLAAFLPVLTVNADEKIVYCYYGTWSVYRQGEGKFAVSSIDPTLCTHLGYSFFGVEEDGTIKSLDKYLDIDLGNIKKVNELKKINPKLKTMAVIGGWNEGSAKYSIIANDVNRRKKFIDSALVFMKKFNFNGLDLDWEYPGKRNSNNLKDKDNFAIWLKEIKEAFFKEKYILAIAVGAAKVTASIAYDIPKISQHVDIINLMTYDFHGSWDHTTGENSPLYDPKSELSVDSAVSYWIESGAPPSKLVMGIPLYGRSFTLADSKNFNINAPTNGPGLPGPLTRTSGFLGYNEICTNKWSEVFDPVQKVPYAHNGNQWVGYDNEQSIGEKVSYAKNKKLGGVMVWSIETDDFRGKCGRSKYPLLKKVNEFLKDEKVVLKKLINSFITFIVFK
ncbi:CHIA.2 family protein [Megaselia abdita]